MRCIESSLEQGHRLSLGPGAKLGEVVAHRAGVRGARRVSGGQEASGGREGIEFKILCLCLFVGSYSLEASLLEIASMLPTLY